MNLDSVLFLASLTGHSISVEGKCKVFCHVVRHFCQNTTYFFNENADRYVTLTVRRLQFSRIFFLSSKNRARTGYQRKTGGARGFLAFSNGEVVTNGT